MATIKEIEEFLGQELPIAKSDADKYERHLENETRRVQKKKDTYKQITFKIRKTEHNMKIIDSLNQVAEESDLPKGQILISQLEKSQNSETVKNDARRELINQIWNTLSDKTKNTYREKHGNLNIKKLISFLEDNNKTKFMELFQYVLCL